MALRNDPGRYGAVSMALHWGMALALIGMFILGLWMRTLSYYDYWYHHAPGIHKSLGVLLCMLLVVRIVWRFVSPPPAVLGSRAIRAAAHLGHLAMYLLMIAIMVAGYLISTAEGQAIDVFGWFSVPATLTGLPDQADIAGDIHLWLAWALMILAGLHVAAALKHHFIDRDATLLRMFGRSTRKSNQ